MKRNASPIPSIYLTAILVLTYLPLLLVMLYSFNAGRLSSVWEGFSLRWYQELFADRAIFEALRNSIVLATASSLAAGAIGTLGAVGMVRSQTRLNGVVAYLSTLPIMIPEIILGMVFLAFFSLLGLPFGMAGLIIGHTVFCIPYVFTMVRGRLAGMDKSYAEAARDLGAGEARAFWDVTFPLLRPAILSGMLISFAMSMDDVIISMFLTDVNTNTLPIKIYTQLKTGVTPKTNALCALMFIFTLALGLLSLYIGRKRNS